MALSAVSRVQQGNIDGRHSSIGLGFRVEVLILPESRLRVVVFDLW